MVNGTWVVAGLIAVALAAFIVVAVVMVRRANRTRRDIEDARRDTENRARRRRP